MLIVTPAVGEQQKPKAPEKAIPIGVAKAVTLSPETKIELPGTALPWATTHLAAEMDGRVDKIFVADGQHVKKGTPLFRLYTYPLELERNLALAQKKFAATRLEELKAGSRKETIDAAKAATEKAQARLNLADIELSRFEKLYKDGIVSINDYDNSRTLANEAKAQYDEKKAAHDEAAAGPRVEHIKQEEASLLAAEGKVRIIEDQIDRSSVYAPFNGYVTKREAEVGQWLEKGKYVLTMIALDPLKVEVNVPQFHFNKIEIGTPALVILENRQADAVKEKFNGHVIEKIFSGDPASRTFPVRIQVGNANSRISAGMLARVEIYPSDGGKTGSLFVHKDAVVRNPKETVVWVIREGNDKNPKAFKIPVTVGEQVDNLVAIKTEKDEIKDGDLVVVQGNERLRPDAKLNIISKSQ